MRNFKEIANEVLKKREEQENNIRVVAKDIIENALKYFENPNINVVYINYNPKDTETNKPNIVIEAKEELDKITDLIYCYLVFQTIKKVLRENIENDYFDKNVFEFEIPEYTDDNEVDQILIRIK